MAKYYGSVGFEETVEISPGVFDERIVVRKYAGDIVRNNRRLENSGEVNDSINVTNQVRIIADPYANTNFHHIRYLTFMGQKWKVKDVSVDFPGLLLTLGGLYNG